MNCPHNSDPNSEYELNELVNDLDIRDAHTGQLWNSLVECAIEKRWSDSNVDLNAFLFCTLVKFLGLLVHPTTTHCSPPFSSLIYILI